MHVILDDYKKQLVGNSVQNFRGDLEELTLEVSVSNSCLKKVVCVGVSYSRVVKSLEVIVENSIEEGRNLFTGNSLFFYFQRRTRET